MNPTTVTHVHLILSHAPFIAILFGLVLLVVGISRGSAEIQMTALAAVTAAAILTLILYLTGKPAISVVKGSSDFVDIILERHRTTAALATAGCSVLGFVAFAGLLLYQGKGITAWYGITILCAGVLVALVLVWTSKLGGQIRHSEIRAATSTTTTAR